MLLLKLKEIQSEMNEKNRCLKKLERKLASLDFNFEELRKKIWMKNNGYTNSDQFENIAIPANGIF